MRLLLAFVLALLERGSLAAEIEGVTFAERLTVAGTPLELASTVLLRYRVAFRGYVGIS